MNSLKFYKILSILLVILNLATLAFFYFNKPPGPPKPGEAHLADEIGLVGEAKKKSDALEIQHHKEKRQLIQQNFELQKQLYRKLSDDSSAREILLKIHQNRAQTDRMTFEFFSEVARLCNEEQKMNLKKVINQGLSKITGHPPRK